MGTKPLPDIFLFDGERYHTLQHFRKAPVVTGNPVTISSKDKLKHHSCGPFVSIPERRVRRREETLPLLLWEKGR
jgi:hypothetical protein